MNKEYIYSDDDFQSLEKALEKSNMVCYGRPDQFQFYQNELTKEIARFILKQYLNKTKDEKNNT